MKFNGLENLGKNSNSKKEQPFEDLQSIETAKRCFAFSLKNYSIVSSLNENEVKLVQNIPRNKIIFEQLGFINNELLQTPFDKELQNMLFSYENELYQSAKEISKEDFKYLKDFSEEDMELLYKILGPYQFSMNFNFNDLELDELVLFARSLKNADDKTFNRLLAYKNKFSDSYNDKISLKPFISLVEGDYNLVDKILNLSEKLPKEVAEKIFKKYSEIIEKIDQGIPIIKEKLKDKDVSISDELAVKDNLLNKAKNLLLKYSENLDKNPEDIIYELESLNIENMYFLSIFQALKNTQNIKFEDLKDFEFHHKFSLAEFVTNEEILEIENIINKNYKNAPEKLRKNLLNSINESLQIYSSHEETTVVPILKYKGKIVAFCRMNWQNIPTQNYWDKDSKRPYAYFGSFNVDPDFANGEIGQVMIERVVEEEAKRGAIIEADCNAFLGISSRYIESGFVALDVYDFHGWKSFKILRDDKRNNEIIGKNLSREEILESLENGYIEKNNKKAFIYSSKNVENFSEIFDELKGGNKILSRYFKNYDENWIIVLEDNIYR